MDRSSTQSHLLCNADFYSQPKTTTTKLAQVSIFQDNNNHISFHSFTGNGFGLPLAVAANLHFPYRIKIGVDQLQDIQVADAAGKGE